MSPVTLVYQDRREKVIRPACAPSEWAPANVLLLLIVEVVHDFAKLGESLLWGCRLEQRWLLLVSVLLENAFSHL